MDLVVNLERRQGLGSGWGDGVTGAAGRMVVNLTLDLGAYSGNGSQGPSSFMGAPPRTDVTALPGPVFLSVLNCPLSPDSPPFQDICITLPRKSLKWSGGLIVREWGPPCVLRLGAAPGTGRQADG